MKFILYIALAVQFHAAIADNQSEKKPLGFSEFRRLNVDKPSSEKSAIKDGNFRAPMVSPKYINQISGLRRNARIPGEKEGGTDFAFKICQCTLTAVLEESPNRTTYFYKPLTSRSISEVMLTAWRYRKDGSEVESFENAIFNAAVNGNTRVNLSLARSDGVKEALGRVVMYKNVDNPNALIVELAAKIDEVTDENLKEVAQFLDDAMNKIDRNLP